jgi:Caspase domain
MMTIRFGMMALVLAGLTAVVQAEDRALIVGVEKYAVPTIKPALGSERDAEEVERFVLGKLNFAPASIRKLIGAQATSQKIGEEFQRWLIEGTKPGDRVFFYYSGHGSYLRDDDGDEKEDGFDETIVPYDAELRGMGMIRDDQFARWIADLTGRRIVMIFDSCHSGTISRGAISPGAKEASARYLVPDESQLQEQGRTRNLLEVSDGRIGDGNRISRQSDAVIISASGAKQTAHSMAVDGLWRGALTWGLIESYKSGAPKLVELRSAIETQIRSWQRSRQLNGAQVPEFEFSSTRLEAEPIFGLWEQVPQLALANPNSKLQVALRVGEAGKQPDARGHLVYYEGETISYRITTNTAGYLYLLAFSRKPETGEHYVTMLFPHPEIRLDNEIRPPGISLPENAEYPVTATGLDLTVALVTTRKLPIEVKEQYSWEEMFRVLNLKELQKEVSELTRDIGVRPRAFDWQAATLPIFTAKKKAQ